MPFKSVPKGSWELRVLPPSQQAESLGAAAALLWKANPANNMSLPATIEAADADGDGTIDVDEFKVMLEKAGAGVDVAKLFAQIDKDGDGELTAEEMQMLQDRNRRFKASSTK